MTAMSELPHATDPVADAWRNFGLGHKALAIELAREAWIGASSPAAAAALGYFLLDAGALKQAEDVLLAAMRKAPRMGLLHWYVGLLRYRQGDVDQAADALRHACLLDETLDEAACTLAWWLHDQGNVQEALDWSQRALRSARLPQRLMQWAWLLQRHGSVEEAVQAYEEAAGAFPANAVEQSRLHLHWAQCLVALEQPHEAALVLAKGLACFPQDPDLMTAQARLEWRRGNTQQAITIAKQQTASHPELVSAWHLLGTLLEQTGDLQAADSAFNEVQQRDMTLVDALLRRASIQARWGNGEAAEWLLQQVLRCEPDSLPALALRAQVLLDLGRTREARIQLHACLQRDPADSELWRLLAVALRQHSRHLVAMRWLAHALRLAPDNIEALRMQAWMELERGDSTKAALTVRRLLTLRPQDHAARVQAAFVFAAAGDVALAANCAEDSIVANPQDPEAWRALSQVRYLQSRLEDAEHAIDIALQLRPGQVDSLRQLGWILIADQRPAHAQLAFLRVLDQQPQDIVALQEAAESCLRAGHFSVGLTIVNRLLDQYPDLLAGRLLRLRLLCEADPLVPDAHAMALSECRRLISLGLAAREVAQCLMRLLGLGVPDAPTALRLFPRETLLEVYRAAISEATVRYSNDNLRRLATQARKEFPNDSWIATASLYAVSLDPHSTRHDLSLRARDWYRGLKLKGGLFFAENPPPRPADAKARIAYVAGQSHQRLLERVIASHDPARVEVFLYSNHPFPPLPAHVRREQLVPERLAQSCAANRIDAVIDTGGLHPFEGQHGLLECYARRVAPLQIGWLGVWGSTGGIFDALLTDDASVPQDSGIHYEEDLWRLKGGQWCWSPPMHAPAPVPTPGLSTGSVTYGVTARSLRLNSSCIAAFARILAETPRTRIRFLGLVSSDAPLQNQILEAMGRHGVTKGRIAFDPYRSYERLFDWCQQIDMVLDTFPGNGGLSLLEPLWMGVPVVTLAGGWPGARQGRSVLMTLGCPQLIASSADEYVHIATALAHDLHALQELREGMRARMQASPITDGHRVARQIEDAITAKLPAYRDLATADAKARIRAQAKWNLAAWMAKETKLTLPSTPPSETPDLSVLVVLYNQAGLTRKTLQAVADQRGASFETIIIDNASSDETQELLKRVEGATIVVNEHNKGFLLAANQAAVHARGRHIVLLNSDAILQPGALAAALERLDSDPSIGAVGGRVVLTSGGLQEAGNAVFIDGSTLGIGRGEDPFCPAALASRATDYVSGVFTAIPAHLWRMLGGFNEAFVPAYYEDADLCLRIWKAGWRVVYEPRVLVEHLEWGSTSDNAEAPRQMGINRERFLACHAELLRKRGHPAPVPLDADRWQSPEDSPRKPRILILDNEVPHMFKGGGLPRARKILQALDQWPVTFFPLWDAEDDWRDVYGSLPRSVEVMLGYGFARLEEFLEQRRGVYDMLVVSRPPNLKALQPLRRRRPELFKGMRLIYDAEALFALREIAEAAVQKRPLTRREAQAKLDAEIRLADGAEQVLVVSERDARYFRQAGHRTTQIGHAIKVRSNTPGPGQRSGLLFVGALHPDTPNEDGLVWFLDEVMPRLARLLPQMPTLSIVGVCRSARIQKRASSTIRVLGSQDQLEPWYDAARVFVAPVRFAGGVPVKVIEAAACGVPVVASAVLARQLGWMSGREILHARDADAFARATARLLRDDALWLRQQTAAANLCERQHNPEQFTNDILQLFQADAKVRA